MADHFETPKNMRIPNVIEKTLSVQQKHAQKAVLDSPRGHVVGPFWAWLYSPKMCIHAQAMGAYVRFETSLPKPLNELAILLTGRRWRSQFEFFAHAKLGIAAGLGRDLIEALRQGNRPEGMSDDEVLVYDAVETLLATSRMPDKLYQQVETRFGVQGTVDLVAAVGYYTMVCLTLNTFRILPEEADMPFEEK